LFNCISVCLFIFVASNYASTGIGFTEDISVFILAKGIEVTVMDLEYRDVPFSHVEM
jgi:uncharacterized UPF0146 family protein